MKTKLLRVALAAALSIAAGSSLAQNATLRILVPYDAGSAVDVTSRLIANGLSKRTGRAVIVENRAGGMGMIAMNGLQAAPADGNTLLADTPATAINPSLFKDKVKYDPIKDLSPVAQMMSLPFMLAIHPDVKASNLKEFTALVKARPTDVNAAAAGTSTRLVGELFAQKTGTAMLQIPYKGASPAMAAVLKNESQAIFMDAANLRPHVETGRMRGLFVTGDKRWSALPDVPTAAEAGLPDYNMSTWFGLFARSGTPAETVNKLNEDIRAVMNSPEFLKYLESKGSRVSTMNAPEFTRFFQAEVRLWADVVSRANIKIE